MKRKYAAIIIDDQYGEIIKLSNSLKEIEEIALIGVAQNAQKGKEIILKAKPDLVFLDIEMPHTNGLEMLRELKYAISWHLHIIFYTESNKYLLEALRESAFDYLIKPYSEFDLKLVTNRFLKHMKLTENQSTYSNASLTLDAKKSPHFLITTIKGYISLKPDNIGYFEYIKDKRHWMVILDHQTIQLKKNTSAEDILRLHTSFIQINQQQIINITYLQGIEGRKCIMAPPFDKVEKLIISRFFFGSVQERFFLL